MWWYHPYIADDAFISLQYARRWLGGSGLSFSDAVPPVEGYSNLLWVLLTAGLGAVGFDLVVAARILGMGSAWALVVVALWAWQGERLREAWPAVLAAAAIIGSGGLSVWASGGLETPLQALLLATSIVAVFPLLNRQRAGLRHLLPATLSLALLALTRADGALFTPVACVVVLFARGIFRWEAWRTAGLLAVGPAMAVGGQTLHRWWAFGDYVPNTARVKGAISQARLEQGWAYQQNALRHAGPLVAGSLILAAWAGWRGTQRARLALIFGLGGAWFAYVIIMGGDIFPGRRHAVAWTIAAALLLAEGLRQILAAESQRGARWGAIAVGTVAVATFTVFQAMDRENWRARDRTWPWDAYQLGLELDEAFGDSEPLIAVNAAGALPYAIDFDAIDMLGLNDGEIARNPSAPPGGKWIGHDVFNANITLGRRPDLIVFSDGRDYARVSRPRPMYRELREHPEFASYANTYLFFEGFERRKASVLIRKDSPKIGIQRTEDEIVIPPVFLSSRKAPAFSREGRLGMNLRPGRTGRLDDLSLPAGEWRIETTADGRLSVEVAGLAEAPLPIAQDTVLSTPGPTSISLLVRAESAKATLWNLRLVRQPPQ